MRSHTLGTKAIYAWDMKPEKTIYSAENLKFTRLKRHLSQKDLGSRVGASRAWINQLENDKDKEESITVGLLKKIGTVLNVEWQIPPATETGLNRGC